MSYVFPNRPEDRWARRVRSCTGRMVWDKPVDPDCTEPWTAWQSACNSCDAEMDRPFSYPNVPDNPRSQEEYEAGLK